MGAGRNRFWEAPTFTQALLTYRVPTSITPVCPALAIAESRTFFTVAAEALFARERIVFASEIFFPRIRSTTRRAFLGETRMNFAVADASIGRSPSQLLLLDLGLAVSRVAVERPRGGELAELVTHHVFRDEDGHELSSVMHGELVPLRRPAPWSAGMPAAGGSPLAAAMRVIDRVHDHAPDRGTDPLPPAAPRLPDRRHALDEHQSNLAGGEAKVRVRPLFRQDLRDRTGGACDLTAFSHLEFDIVDERPDRDVPDRKSVPRLDVRAGARPDRGAAGDPGGTEDVPFPPVRVVQQGDPRGAVRVVLDGGDGRRDVFLVPLEVDDPTCTCAP